MTDKKNNRLRRTPSLDSESKQQDQVLSTASSDAPKIGKIAPPQKKPQPAAKPEGEKQSQPRKRQQNTGEKKNQNRAGQAGNKKTGTPQNRNNTKPAGKPAPKPAQKPAGRPAKQQANAAKAGQNKQAANTVKAAAPANKAKTGGRRGPRKNTRSKKPPIKVYFLGGLNEIGKNFTLFECMGDMVIVDCGMAFPDEDMLGIDIVIPDFSFVEKNRDKIRGIVITHGHEDHIGALPYLLKRVNLPVYATALTIGLIGSKLKEHNLTNSARLNVVSAGSTIKLGCMDVEFIHVNHSVADACGLALHTPAGTLVHTGDFKIDCTPAEGEMIDLARFAELGKAGVLALFADSTNAERAGYTMTEQKVNDTLDGLFAKAEGKRLIIATFASNISRVQQIMNCAAKYGRKVALSGRSMLNVMGIATELGYLKVPAGVLIEMNMLNRYNKSEIVLITTGSQGEPMSALTRMAFADHRQVEVGEDDFIILSARPIPGNEKTVGAVVNELLKKGCHVVYESIYDVHVSGHACQEELKIIQALVRPQYFIPVHGEQKHLRKNADIAVSLGMSEDNIFIGDVGNVFEIHENYLKKVEDVPAGAVMVDGLGVGDVGSIVLRDRKHLAEDGIIIAICSIEAASGHVVSGPDVVSRGFVYVRESEKLMDEARELVYNTLEGCAENGVRDWNDLKQNIKEELSRYLYRKTKRSPMILPIIMEV